MIVSEASYAKAVDIMKERAVSFYHAFSNLPEERFRGVAAVYAFCRTADDIADNEDDGISSDNRDVKLNELEAAVRSLYSDPDNTDISVSGKYGAWPWWNAFADTVCRFNIPPDGFMEQIKGQRMDVFFAGIETTNDLINYSAAVAGSVGIMMLPMLSGVKTEQIPEGMSDACKKLGIGMQITNILRDVGEDLKKRGRLYLPSDMMIEHGLKKEDLVKIVCDPEISEPGKTSVIPENFIKLWEDLSDKADSFYEPYMKYLHLFHPDCRVPLVAAALNYHAIADAVRESGYDCFTRRNYTSEQKRTELLSRACEISGMLN